jgi:hypothetical protein
LATIKKTDANPTTALILSLLIINLGALIINGQQRKFIFTAVAMCLTWWFLLGVLIWVLSAIDTMQTAERLQKGEEIDENEYTNELLYKIIKIVDSTATFKGATSTPAA